MNKQSSRSVALDELAAEKLQKHIIIAIHEVSVEEEGTEQAFSSPNQAEEDEPQNIESR